MANLRVDKITSTETFETTGSVQFDGSGDYLSHAVSSDFQFGSDDFTIECWIYKEATQNDDILGVYNTSSNRRSFLLHTPSEGTIVFLLSPTGSGGTSFTTDENIIEPSTWYHIAVVRNGDDVKIFKDGSLVKSGSYSGSVYENNDDEFRIGSTHYSAANSREFDGHISNVRIIKGKALYTANFKPPMRELEVTPETVLLACQSKTDTTLEKTGKTLTANGNAVANELTPGILTPVPKAGGGSAITGSVEFDGTGDYMTVTETEDFDFGTGDFTIEYWYWESNNSKSERRTLDMRDSTRQWMIGHTNDNGGKIFFEAVTGGVTVQVFSENNANTTTDRENWRHLAVVRNGNTITIYLDGVNRGSGSFTGTIRDDQNTLNIGRDSSTTTRNYQGFLSNLRIVKGTALYTDDFIPPTRELKKVPGTVLLCCQDSNNPTQEATGKTISLNGIYTYDTVVNSGITTTPGPSNFTPQIGDYRKVTFEGVTKINSDAYFYLPTGDTVTRDTRSGRGIVGGGQSPSRTNAINFIQIQSTGNAQDFGDLTGARDLLSACASSTRGIFGGGYLAPPSTYLNVMEFVTIASTGDALDFGDLSVDRQGPGSCSNSTRGVFAGGSDPGNLNTIDFVTIASTGDATDFGDLITKRAKHKGCGSSIRAIIFSPEPGEDIQFFNYASTGRATSFGEMTPGTKGDSGVASDSTRALRFGGGTHPEGDISNNISYITISSTGNEQEFGDLFAAGSQRGTAMSNSIRAVQIVNNKNGQTNIMEYVTIQSTGNGKDFGDLNTTHLSNAGSTSDSHGGVG